MVANRAEVDSRNARNGRRRARRGVHLNRAGIAVIGTEIELRATIYPIGHFKRKGRRRTSMCARICQQGNQCINRIYRRQLTESQHTCA